jgi:hypothetical protein
MTRIDRDSMDWCDLERLATERLLKVVYRRARCQHGYTRDETCVSCEGGYATDHAYYANVGNVATLNGQDLIAVSDDGTDVAYVPASQQSKLG